MIKPRKMRYCYNCVTLILIKTVPLSVLVSNCFVPRENTLFSSLRIVCCFVLIISLALSYSPFLIVEYKNPALHLLPRRRERCNDLCLECLCFPGSYRAWSYRDWASQKKGGIKVGNNYNGVQINHFHVFLSNLPLVNEVMGRIPHCEAKLCSKVGIRLSPSPGEGMEG